MVHSSLVDIPIDAAEGNDNILTVVTQEVGQEMVWILSVHIHESWVAFPLAA